MARERTLLGFVYVFVVLVRGVRERARSAGWGGRWRVTRIKDSCKHITRASARTSV